MSTTSGIASRDAHADDAWACVCWPTAPEQGEDGQPRETVVGYFQTVTPDPFERPRAAVTLRPKEDGTWSFCYSGEEMWPGWRGSWASLLGQAHKKLLQWLVVQPAEFHKVEEQEDADGR